MAAVDPTRAEIQQTIRQTNARVSEIFSSMDNAASIYSGTYLAANGMAPTSGTTPTTNGTTNGASVFSTTNGTQQTFGSFNYSPNGIDTNFVRAYGSYLRDLSARLDANMAQMAAQDASAQAVANGTQGAKDSQAATNVDAPMNFNNSVEPFSKLTDEQIKALSDKEEEIAKKQEAMKTETDAKKKNEIAKEIKTLQKAYKQLEKEYGANNLSSMFGKSYDFYRNLSPDEISQIREANKEIADMRETIEAKQSERKEAWEKIQKQIQEYQAKTGQMPTADQIMSPTEKEFFEQSKTEIEELQKQVNTAIDNLHKNTKAASKDKGETYFATENITRENNANSEKKDSSLGNAANALFDEKGKANSEATIKKAFNEISGFDKADKDAVAKFLSEQIANKDKNALDSKEFFEAAVSSTFVGDNKDNLGLLMAVYDKIKGEGAFKAKATEFGKDKGKVNALVREIEELEKQQAAAKAKGTDPAKTGGTATGKATDTGKSERTDHILSDANGKAKSAGDIKKTLEGISGFDKADKDAVAKFLSEQIANNNEEALDSKEFFEAATTGTFVGDNKDNLGLLMTVYDKIKGEGAFKANAAKFGADKGKVNALVREIEALERQQAAKAGGAKGSGTASGTNTPTVRNADAKAKFNELLKPDEDGKVNWESVKAEVDKIIADDNKTQDYKLQLKSLYNSARTQAELAAIVEKYPSTSQDGGKIPYKGFMGEITKLQGTEHGAAAEGKALIGEAVSSMSLAKAEEILKDLKAENKLGDDSVATLKQALAEQKINLSDNQIKSLCGQEKTTLTLAELNSKISDLITNNNGDLSSITDDQLIDFFEYHNTDGRKTIDSFVKNKQNSEAIRNLAIRLNQIAQKEGISKRMKYYNPLLQAHSLNSEKGHEITSTTDLNDLCGAAGNIFRENTTTFTMTAISVCNGIRAKRKQ